MVEERRSYREDDLTMQVEVRFLKMLVGLLLVVNIAFCAGLFTLFHYEVTTRRGVEIQFEKIDAMFERLLNAKAKPD